MTALLWRPPLRSSSDHGDQADGEQRLGDQVVGGDPVVTIAPYVIRAARSRTARVRQRCGRVVEVTAVTCESGKPDG